MQVKNKEEYKEISTSSLGFSTRTFNCLMRAGYNTLYLIIENYDTLGSLRNMGTKSLCEIDYYFKHLDTEEKKNVNKNGDQAVIDSSEEDKLSDEILDRPVTDLHVTIRVLNSLYLEGIKTIRQVINLSLMDLLHFRNMGKLSAQQLQEQISFLKKQKEEYFQEEELSENIVIDTPEFDKHELDISTAKTLIKGCKAEFENGDADYAGCN